MNYEVIKSKRKTIAIQVNSDGQVAIRVPSWYTQAMIQSFAEEHWQWVERKVAEQTRLRHEREQHCLTEEERQECIFKARMMIPERVAYYASIMDVTYGKITIKEQKTRWGSCSAKGNLNFNWRLVLAPESVLDYVVVHELAHRVHMNHSKDFYNLVAAIMPGYEHSRRWLKVHGGSIL